jgi:outer membrane receptor for ferrienterochelin and colicins
MSSGLSQFRLSLMPFSLLIAFGSNAIAQEVAAEKQAVPQASTVPPAKVEAKPTKPTPPIPAVTQKVQVSGAKGYDERRQDTASKIVVTQEEIARYGDTNIGDVLKRLPGVTIGGVQGRGGSIRMRGLGSGYTQIMLNGEPSPPGFSLDSLSPDNIERIEVIRSATAELSTQAIAGAINIVLKRAIVTEQIEFKGGISEENGKYGVNSSLQISDRVGRMSYSVSGNLIKSDFNRPTNSVEVGTDKQGKTILSRHTDGENNGYFSMFSLSPRLNWNLQNGDVITSQSFVNFRRFKNDGISKTDTLIGDKPLYLSEKSNMTSDSTSLRTNLNWMHKLADSAKLDMRFGATFEKRESDSGQISNGVTQQLTRSSNNSRTEKEFTFGGKYTAPFIEEHSLAAGWDGGLSKKSEDNFQNDSLTGIGIIRPLNLNETFDANVNRLALYAQDEWAVTKLWSIYMGARWEGIDTSSQGSTYAEIKNRSSVLSPILQTLYKLPGSKNDQLRLGISRTYKAPDPSRLIPRRFFSSNNSATSPDFTGNPNLKPELAWGLDTGFEHYLTDGGVMSVNFYLRRIEDFTRTATFFENDRWVSMSTNNGTASTRGVEFDAKFPLRSVMKDVPDIDIRANLSFNSSTVDSVPGPNNRLDSQTPVSANFGVDYKLSTMPLTLGGNLSFQNGGLVQISTNQSAYSIPKRVADVYALWKFDNKTNLRLALGNALHQDNISSSTYRDANGALVRSSISPTNVSMRLNLEHKF